MCRVALKKRQRNYSNIAPVAFSVLALCYCVHAGAATDPTKPLVAGLSSTSGQSAVPKPGELVLQSIIAPSLKSSALTPEQRSANYKAIISGQLVAKGQQVDGFQVVDISERQVILQSEDKSKELVLFTHPVVTYK
ncbi:hypothetical protein DXX93_17440 [Thalassotalea euphylliae]|uniref:MSHA biogenesis protein MshK n=1 Tax=Thalassotalea euphylliae TaxID=1655234 RepID=A0A3E0TU12_9GAMM|nr:hypothetical protein [Thalassotalea euphylliae]REL28171.1 hypothetical protein DXX93_17440 [Thalassotalea euphylliae]